MPLRKLQFTLLLLLSALLAGCAGPQPVDHSQMKQLLQDRQYAVIEDNSGLYMSPFTSDGVAAEWVEKSINAKMGSGIGGMAGAYAGQKALEQVPFVGGILGQHVGESIGRATAIKMVGGEQAIKDTSDLSFNDFDNMAGWMIANHGDHTRFKEILDAAQEIYPELQQAYFRALASVHQPVPPVATADATAVTK